MALKTVLSLAFLMSTCFAHDFNLRNNCKFTVWPGFLNNPGKALPEGGGFAMAAGSTRKVTVAAGWAGRLWGRTNCAASGHCETGDCGGKIACGGAGGVPPVSLAEITTDANGQDYYDVSLVDGYNLPMRMAPTAGTFKKNTNDKYDCGVAGCTADLNAHCPSELALKVNGATVACKSACEAFNTDEYCCRGAHDKPQTCKSSSWPKNYPATFKASCPDAYSYAYDDLSSTFICHGNPTTSYDITFCP